TFHPQYLFEGEDEDDMSHFTNRSPYPMLHIIREDDMEQALASVRFPERIPERNREHIRRLGKEGLLQLMPALAQSRLFQDVTGQQASLKPPLNCYHRGLMPMIKFPLLLWALSLLMKKAARNNPDFRKQLEGKDFAFQLQTADGGIVRQFVVANNSIRSKRKAHSNPAFTISFKNADTGLR